MVWGCSKICDLKKKSTTPLLDNLSPGSGVSFYKINSHIPYYAHEIFNGISLLKILTSFVVFDYKAIVPALSIDKASSWPFNEAGDMRSRLL